MKQILLSSKNKEIKEYTLVSDEDYDHLIQYKMYSDKDGYVLTYINKKMWRLHRYIMIEIHKYDINRHNIIDHKNNNKKDNTRENLRIVTSSENSKNRLKSKNATSKYFGVFKHNNGWQSSLNFNNKILYASYKLEACISMEFMDR